MRRDGRLKALSLVRISSDKVRVTEWILSPGAATGWHRHEHDYLVVPLATGRLMLVGPHEEEHHADLATGVPYNRSAGVQHDVINANAFEFRFLEIEMIG